MKTLLKLCGVVIVLLLALTACNLYDQINVRWTITNVDSLSLPTVRVDYTVWNDGKYALNGVNLEIGVYAVPFGDYISDWTLPDFSLAVNETKTGSIDINIGGNTASGAAVLGVDMDNPKDS